MSNTFSCVGTVVRDAETRYIPSGQALLTVTIANNQGFGDKQSTLFIRCAVWGKKAESKLIDFLKKGQQIYVSGELRQQEYEKDGVTKTSLELNCNIIDLVGGNRGDNQQAIDQQRPQQTQQRPQQQQRQPAQSNQDAPYDDFDSDIPFN